MDSTRKILAVFLVILAFAGGTLFMIQSIQRGSAPPAFATVWPSPKPLAEFHLVDQGGSEFTKNRLSGQWSLMFFGFTNCPDICPATLQQLAIANKNLEEAGLPVPDIIFVSVDPERDTPDVLTTYVSHFAGDILGVTGDITELTRLTSSIGIFFEKAELPTGDDSGNYSVDHSAVVLVINEDGAIHASFSAPHNIENFVHDLPILMGSN
jgi:protein SCO1/2